MSKITPQDYIDAQSDLVRAGYLAIKGKAKNTSTADVAKAYGVSETVVELIKTSGTVSEFETIVRLEQERNDADKRINETQTIEPKPFTYNPEPTTTRRPTTLALVIAGIIVLAFCWGVVQLIIWLFNVIGGLF